METTKEESKSVKTNSQDVKEFGLKIFVDYVIIQYDDLVGVFYV